VPCPSRTGPNRFTFPELPNSPLMAQFTELSFPRRHTPEGVEQRMVSEQRSDLMASNFRRHRRDPPNRSVGSRSQRTVICLAIALMYVGRPANWIDIYKALECFEGHLWE
jgi:hypothetical protein